jgi:hypothetical protein
VSIGALGQHARLSEQRIDIGDGQHFRQRAGAFRAAENGGGIVVALVLGEQKAEQVADRRHAACDGRRLEVARIEAFEIGTQIIGGRGKEVRGAALEKVGAALKIGAVGGERVGAGAKFGGHHVEEQRDQGGIGVFSGRGHCWHSFRGPWFNASDTCPGGW